MHLLVTLKIKLSAGPGAVVSCFQDCELASNIYAFSMLQLPFISSRLLPCMSLLPTKKFHPGANIVIIFSGGGGDSPGRNGRWIVRSESCFKTNKKFSKFFGRAEESLHSLPE